MGTAKQVAKAAAVEVASDAVDQAKGEIRQEVESALKATEGRIDARLEGIRTSLTELKSAVEGLKDGRIAAAVLDQRVKHLEEAHDKLEREFGEMDQRLDQTNKDVASLKATVVSQGEAIKALENAKQRETKHRVKDAGLIVLVLSMLIPVIMYAIQAFSGTDQPPPNVPNVNQPTQAAPQQPGAPADSAP